MKKQSPQNQKNDKLPVAIAKRLMECEGYIDLKMFHRAKEILADLPQPYQKHTLAWLLKYRIEFENKNWRKARQIASALLKMDDSSSEHWIILASAERRCGLIKNAIKVLEKASPKFPDCAVIYYNLACYYCLNSDIDKAMPLLKKAFQLEKQLVDTALADPDLKVIRDKIPMIIKNLQ